MTKKELASIAGYTYRRLYDINQALPEEKKLFVESKGGKCDLAIFVKRWVAYNVDKETGDEMSLDEVRAKHEQVKTEKTMIEVARLRGQLVEIDAIRQAWGDVANTVMQKMITLPGKIAPQVIMMDNVEAINGIIDKEIRDALTAIAETPIPAQTEQAYDEEKEEE